MASQSASEGVGWLRLASEGGLGSCSCSLSISDAAILAVFASYSGIPPRPNTVGPAHVQRFTNNGDSRQYNMMASSIVLTSDLQHSPSLMSTSTQQLECRGQICTAACFVQNQMQSYAVAGKPGAVLQHACSQAGEDNIRADTFQAFVAELLKTDIDIGARQSAVQSAPCRTVSSQSCFVQCGHSSVERNA